MKFLIYDSSFCPNNISLQKYAAKILFYSVLLFYFCQNILPQIQQLKTTQIYYCISQFCSSGAQLAWPVSLLQVSHGQTQAVGLPGLFYLEAPGKTRLLSSLRLLHTLVPCKCKIEVPISWLAISVGSLLTSRNLFPFHAHGPLYLSASDSMLDPFHAQTRKLTSPSATSLLFPVRGSSLLQGLV